MNPINLKQSSDPEAVSRKQRAENQAPAEARRANQPDTRVGARRDMVSVSDRAAAVSSLVEKTNALPDVRGERVEALRLRLEKGDYNPPAADIAAAILRDEN